MAHYSPTAIEFKKNELQKEMQNHKSKACNSSHHGALIHLKPKNSPHAHQKPIKGGHFHHSNVWLYIVATSSYDGFSLVEEVLQ